MCVYPFCVRNFFRNLVELTFSFSVSEKLFWLRDSFGGRLKLEHGLGVGFWFWLGFGIGIEEGTADTFVDLVWRVRRVCVVGGWWWWWCVCV